MNKKMKKSQYVFIIVSVIIIIALYVIYNRLGLKIENFPLLAFIISVVASILASLVYSILDDFFFKTKQDELIDKLTQSTQMIDSMITKGIVRLQYRNEISDEYWNSFIINAGDTLILSGKTLYRWIRFEELKSIFTLYLVKKIKAGCKVTFVIYKVDNLQGRDQQERDDFKKFLNEEIFSKIYRKNESTKGSLTIKETEILPYFYITNGIESVVMPYFANVSNDKNLALILKSNNNKLDRTYLEDYQNIIKDAADNSWIKEYKNQHGLG